MWLKTIFYADEKFFKANLDTKTANKRKSYMQETYKGYSESENNFLKNGESIMKDNERGLHTTIA